MRVFDVFIDTFQSLGKLRGIAVDLNCDAFYSVCRGESPPFKLPKIGQNQIDLLSPTNLYNRRFPVR